MKSSYRERISKGMKEIGIRFGPDYSESGTSTVVPGANGASRSAALATSIGASREETNLIEERVFRDIRRVCTKPMRTTAIKWPIFDFFEVDF